MSEPSQTQQDAPTQLPLPDPEKLKPTGPSNKHKRYLYYVIFAVLALLADRYPASESADEF